MADLYKTKSTTILVPEDVNESVYKLKIFNSSMNVLVHILIGIIVGVTVILVYSFGSPPSWGMLHMLLCVIGYQLLMAEGILSLSPDNGWSSFMKLRDKKRAHWILQIVGSVLAIIGTVMEIMQKNVHFDSLHGKYGLVAMVFTILSLINGLTSLYAYECRKIIPPIVSKVSHSLFGCFAFVTSSISLCYGFDMQWFREWLIIEELGTVIIVFTALFTFIVIINPFAVLYTKYVSKR
ncbi:uncharacterized protein LOC106135685 [Amyelois transitella]|uniref:uncharacterized protein LOC106135685 n=1 Tax=Amyelois transitella TaxID=680683 RepID=UPI00067AB7DC|nr:uncharacterized protein LOC106135685 [Amyelois transitella]